MLLPLITGHLIGDFVLQTQKMVADKKRTATRLFHATIVTLVSWVLVGYWYTWWWLIPVLLISHFLIDSAKTWLGDRVPALSGPDDPSWFARHGEAALFVADQAAHLTVVLGLVYVSAQPGLAATVAGESAWISRFGPAYLDFLVLVSGFVLAVHVSGIVLGFLLRRFAVQEKGGLPGGGLHIGLLERAIIFIFVMAGQPAGIGFLMAAKSVFRFGELKDREDRALAEYILVGTLMSFTFAMVIAYATRYLLREAF